MLAKQQKSIGVRLKNMFSDPGRPKPGGMENTAA
jgi:hypothetical protein